MKRKPLKRLLIANRGEIAVRIIRAARDLGIETVAVYSEADANGMALKMADCCVPLTGNLASETYLNVPALLDAIKRSGADSVHPGYGFLSENADFAEAVEKSGAKFVGPSPKAMRLMGDKVAAKKLMKQHDVPTVPGSKEALSSYEELRQVTTEIGYPVILKAAAGGGGRGMRVVRKEDEIKPFFEACTREALAYFGNPAVFCERYIERPRHIEVQVLFDAHGNGVHLFERDCSVQRRHQKLIEEAPSLYLNAEQRQRIGDFAVRAAAAAGYESAGTIEFICDSPDQIYFMEMNTRIQVEHTVSEEISGVDLVKAQLKIAQGEPLGFAQKDLSIRGWAFEMRINAEDPARAFAPGPGVVKHVRFPAGPGVRIDSHLYAGYEIPQFYDSMVAKLIVTGATRSEAIARSLRALAEFEMDGVPTTIPFHQAVLQHRDFIMGEFTTKFVEEFQDELVKPGVANEEQILLGALQAQPERANLVSSKSAAWLNDSRRRGMGD